MGPLTDQDRRDRRFVGVALNLGYADPRHIDCALQRVRCSGNPPISLRAALIEVAGLDTAQIAAIGRIIDQDTDADAADSSSALPEAAPSLPQAAQAPTRPVTTVLLEPTPASEVPPAGLRQVPPGRYTDFRRVGAGGMGVVFLALDSDLNRNVAFKIVNPAALAGAPPTAQTPSELSPPEPDTPASKAFATLKARFLQEALITGHLAHPNIVPVYEVGQTPQGVPYYTMKFVRGERTFAAEIAAANTLEDRLGLLEPFLDLCDAVAYAHEQGVIHRDLKPQNVQRGSFGETVLLDWGLARTRQAPDPGADDRWRERIQELRGEAGLRTLGVMGTPGYMAPEALHGDPEHVDEHSDQYSLGVVLFQILTGRLPHALDHSLAPAAAFQAYRALVQSEDAPRADRLNPTVPRPLADTVARALLRTPQDRFPSVKDLAGAIRAWQRESAQRQQQAEKRAAALRVGLAAAGVLVLAITAFLWRTEILRQRAEQEEARAVLAEKDATRQRDAAKDKAKQLAEQEQALAQQLDDAYWEAYSKFTERHDPASQFLVAVTAQDRASQNRIASPRSWPFLGRLALENAPRLVSSSPVGYQWHSIAYTPDGRLLVAGGGTGDGNPEAIRLWDMASGQELATLKGDRGSVGPVSGIAVAHDSQSLVSASRSGNLRVWDLNQSRMVASLRGDIGLSACVALSRDGKWLAHGGRPVIRLWEIATHRQGASFRGHTASVYSVAFSPDGRALASGSVDKTVRLWDPNSGLELATLSGHTMHVNSVAFSPDGALLASGGDKTVRLWDVAGRRQTATLTGHGGEVKSVVFSPDGTLLASGGADGTVRLWDVAARREKLAMACGPGRLRTTVLCVAFAHDGRTVAAASSDGRIALWDPRTGQQVAESQGSAMVVDSRLEAQSMPFGGLALSRDSHSLATLSPNNTLRLWDVPSCSERANCGEVMARSLEFSPDGAILAAVTPVEGTIRLWDVATAKEKPAVGTVAGGAGRGLFAFAPDSKRLATCTEDGSIRVLGLTGSQERTIPRPQTGEYCSVTFSPDGKTLALVATDRTLGLWDLASGQRRTELTGAGVRSDCPPVFSPDGTRIVMVGSSGSVSLWDAATGQEKSTVGKSWAWSFPSPGEPGVVFSADGRFLCFACEDGGIRLWDVTTERAGVVLRWDAWQRRGTMMTPMLLSADGRTLISACNDNAIVSWDVAAASPKAILRAAQGAAVGDFRLMRRLACSADGRTVITSGLGGTIRVWEFNAGPDGVQFDGLRCGPVSPVAFSPDGSTLATGEESLGAIRLWDTKTGRETARIGVPVELAREAVLAFSPDGSVLAAATKPGEVRLWDLSTGGRTKAVFSLKPSTGTDLLGVVTGPGVTRVSLSFSPDGRTLAVAAVSPSVTLLDAGTGNERLVLRGHTWNVTGLCFSPQGDSVASLGQDGTARVWDAVTGEERGRFEGNAESALTAVAFSPDGQVLAIAAEGAIVLWSPVNGIEGNGPPNKGWARELGFSPDGKTLVSVGGDIEALLWDTTTLTVKATWSAPGLHIARVTFIPDGTLTALCGFDGRDAELRNLIPAPAFTTTEAGRLAWMRLAGFESEELPPQVSDAPCDFVAMNGPSFPKERKPRGMRPPAADVLWSEQHPFHWLRRAEQGDVEAMYRLAVIRERAREDTEARALHIKVAGVTDPAQAQWARNSRTRLRTLPWLQPWTATYEKVGASFDTADFEEGLVEYRKATDLGAEDRQALAAKLVTRLGTAALLACEAADYSRAEKACGVALGLDSEAAGMDSAIRMAQALTSARHAFGLDNLDGGVSEYRRVAPTLSPAERASLERTLASILVGLAEGRCAAGECAAAIEHCQRALDIRPMDPQALSALGRAHQAMGDRRAAEEAFEQASAANSADPGRSTPTPDWCLANLLWEDGQRDQAVEHYRKAVELGLDGLSAKQTALRLWHGGRPDDAIALLAAHFDRKRSFGLDVLALWVAMLYQEGRAPDMGAHLGRALQTASLPPDLRLACAISAAAQGKSTEALTQLRVFLANATPDQLTFSATADLLDLGLDLEKPLTAIAAAEPGLLPRLKTHLAWGYLRLADARRERGEPDDAVAACNQALALEGGSAVVQRWAGTSLSQVGRHEQALACLRKAVELDPKDADAYGALGWTLYRLGQYDEAMAVSLKAVGLNAKLAYVHADLGLLHVLKRDLGKAMPCYAKVAEIAPADVEKLAIADLLDLVQKQPALAEAHYALGFCYEKKGDPIKAGEQYQTYVDAAKAGEFVDQAKARLAELAPKPEPVATPPAAP